MNNSSKEKIKLGQEALQSFFEEIEITHKNEQELLYLIFELLCSKNVNFFRFMKNENLPLSPEDQQEGFSPSDGCSEPASEGDTSR